MKPYTTDIVDRLYMSRKEVGIWLINIKDRVDASIQLKDCREKKRRQTDYRNQKQYWKHGDKKSWNILQTKTGIKQL